MILDLINPANWFGQSRAKLSGGPGNQDRRDAGTGNYANKPVTLDTALQLSAFWAAVKLTAQTIGTLPLVLYEREADGSRVVARDHPLHAVLRDRPNADQTAVEFWEGLAAWMLVWGNGYAQIARRGDGQVSSLLPMPADRVTVRRDQDGARRYRFNDRGRALDLPETEVFHLRGFGLSGDTGLSVIHYARQTLGSAMAAEEASGSTFANGMRPSGFFKAEVQGNGGMLTSEQRRQAKEVLIDPYTGAGNTARVGILEGPFSWMPTTQPARDNDLLGTRGFNVEDVCRWVGIPPILIGHASSGQTMWGSGVEQIMLGWLTLSLRAQLQRIQQSVNRALLAPADRGRFYAEHVIDALLQADSTARGELYWKLIQVAAITPNQIAQKENFPTFEGGDVRLVNSTLLPLDKAGVDKISTKQDPAT